MMFQEKRYSTGYGPTNPGDNGAFLGVIVVILILAGLAYSQM